MIKVLLAAPTDKMPRGYSADITLSFYLLFLTITGASLEGAKTTQHRIGACSVRGFYLDTLLYLYNNQ